eukprot:scaffold2551_cov113-Cylindrotheca_fusiformis.AAC.4
MPNIRSRTLSGGSYFEHTTSYRLANRPSGLNIAAFPNKAPEKAAIVAAISCYALNMFQQN